MNKINEYKDLREFVCEYDSGRRSSTETHGRKFMGIEFLYRGVYYRMCREPLEDERGIFQVYIMHCNKQVYPIADSFEMIGRYEKFQDLLENFLIDGVPFKEVIVDDKTEILSKD